MRIAQGSVSWRRKCAQCEAVSAFDPNRTDSSPWIVVQFLGPTITSGRTNMEVNTYEADKDNGNLGLRPGFLRDCHLTQQSPRCGSTTASEPF